MASIVAFLFTSFGPSYDHDLSWKQLHKLATAYLVHGPLVVDHLVGASFKNFQMKNLLPLEAAESLVDDSVFDDFSRIQSLKNQILNLRPLYSGGHYSLNNKRCSGVTKETKVFS
ncbi:hypothetical protein VNO77_07632 [Canavalia gladiata]|uniref:Uncharacterized protein n=1 Tax=Canavalia gladiata TaxID=3824 RepID=A0AAN9M7T3_CANGL